MKNLLLTFLILCLVSACSEATDPTPDQHELVTTQFPQKWQLISMSGQIANEPPATGASMAWQEYYLLNTDGTFSKSRERKGKIQVFSGKFTIEDLSDRKYLILSYDAANEIIGTCTPEPKEVLALAPNGKLYNSWSACDGPGLVYSKVNIENTKK